MSDRNDVNSPVIITVVLAGVLGLLVLILGMQGWFLGQEESIYAEKSAGAVYAPLEKLRLGQQDWLRSTGPLNADKQTVKIPIDDAMRIMVRTQGKFPTTQESSRDGGGVPWQIRMSAPPTPGLLFGAVSAASAKSGSGVPPLFQSRDGSATIQSRDGSATIQSRDGSATIQSRDGSATIQSRDGSGTTQATPPVSVPAAPSEEWQDVGVTEHLSAQLPLNLTFQDEEGKTVALGDFFQKGRPVILQLGYYRCPMLCTEVSRGIVESLKGLDSSLDGKFQVVMVSVDPNETPELARAKKENSIKAFGRPKCAAGWHFLVGKPDSIRKLADAVGFRYKYIKADDQFSHPAVISVCTPDGRISRYLYGVTFNEKTLRLSLVEASDGKIGSAGDQLLLICFHYDPSAGGYILTALNIMRAGGVLTVLVLALVLWRLFRRERRLAAGKISASTP